MECQCRSLCVWEHDVCLSVSSFSISLSPSALILCQVPFFWFFFCRVISFFIAGPRHRTATLQWRLAQPLRDSGP